MNAMERLARQIMDALGHAIAGKGPASVRVVEKDGTTVAAVVFVVPGPAGEIVADALDKLYDALGWTKTKSG